MCHGANRAGTSRQLAPVCITHRAPSRNARGSRHRLPRRGGGIRSGARCAQTASARGGVPGYVTEGRRRRGRHPCRTTGDVAASGRRLVPPLPARQCAQPACSRRQTSGTVSAISPSPPFSASAAVVRTVTSVACASKARVAWRCQLFQRRTVHWSSPASPFAAANARSIPWQQEILLHAGLRAAY